MTNVPVPYAYNSERQRVKSLLTYLLCSSTLALLILQLLLLLLLLLWLRYLLLLVVHGHLESIEWVVGSSLFIALTQHCLDLLCASTQVHQFTGEVHTLLDQRQVLVLVQTDHTHADITTAILHYNSA